MNVLLEVSSLSLWFAIQPRTLMGLAILLFAWSAARAVDRHLAPKGEPQ